MFSRSNRPLKPTLSALSLSLLLAACGGGSSDPTPTPSTTINGVAAAGLPLVGTVTVKDSLGATRSAAIGSNGSYSIDVNGMTAPFVFRASGSAGGREYEIHSAATAADVGGVINVTPLTDLVLSNVAGEVAAAYFARNPDAALTATALDAEIAQLRTRLLPVLQAMGVDASIDLLRTPFTPLSSALDKAIDILRVDYGSDGVATLTNVVTQQTIQDDLATQAAQETAAAVMDNTTGVADAATDITLIRAALDNFSALFASGLPAAGVIEAELSQGFLFRDETATEFASELASELASVDLLIGVSFTDVTIKSIDYSGANPRADVSFIIESPAGNLISSNEESWQLVKQAGVWRLHGDQRVIDVQSASFMYKNAGLNSCAGSGLSLRVADYNPANNGGTVSYVIVTGPGIPTVGARLNAPELGGDFQIDQATSNGGYGNFYAMAGSCGGFEVAGLATVPDYANYTFRFYDAQATLLQTYTTRIGKRPLTLAELTATTAFPVITSPSVAAFSSFVGGNLDIAATGLDPLGTTSFRTFLFYSSSASNDADVEILTPASGEAARSFTLPALPVGTSVSYRLLEVANRTPTGREFWTRYESN